MARRSKTATVAHMGLGILGGIAAAGTLAALLVPGAAVVLLPFLGGIAPYVAGLSGAGAVAVGARHFGAREPSAREPSAPE